MSELRPRALVVEDDRSWQQILSEILGDMGLLVDVADNLEAATRSLSHFGHRLAVVDLSLRSENPHNQDGLQVLQSVRQMDPGCVAMLLTGFATVELAVNALTEYGAYTCLQKEQFQRSQFQRVVREALASQPPAGERPFLSAGVLAEKEVRGPGPQFAGASALVVDDDAGWRGILSELLSDLGFDVQLCAGYGEALGALKRIKPRLAVVDLSLSGAGRLDLGEGSGDLEGFRLLEAIQQSKIPAIVVSGVGGPAEIERVYREKGIFAYLEKQTFDRKSFLRTVSASQQAPEDDELGGLTEREREVLSLLGQGLTNKEIADRLVITTNTVKRHIKAIFIKLGVHTRSAAAAKLK